MPPSRCSRRPVLRSHDPPLRSRNAADRTGAEGSLTARPWRHHAGTGINAAPGLDVHLQIAAPAPPKPLRTPHDLYGATYAVVRMSVDAEQTEDPAVLAAAHDVELQSSELKKELRLIDLVGQRDAARRRDLPMGKAALQSAARLSGGHGPVDGESVCDRAGWRTCRRQRSIPVRPTRG